MNKYIIFALIFVAIGCSLVTPAFKNEYRKIVIDGSLSDWDYSLDDHDVDETGRVKYAIANDNDNLYIVLRIFDYTSQSKFFLGGMEMTLDTSVNQLNKTKIVYPFTKNDTLLNNEKISWAFNVGERRGIVGLKDIARKYNDSIIYSGFYQSYNGKKSVKDSSQIQVAFDWDEDDALIYEIKVPFDLFFVTASKQEKPKVNMSFSIKGIPMSYLPPLIFKMAMKSADKKNKKNNTAPIISKSPYGGSSGLTAEELEMYQLYTFAISHDVEINLWSNKQNKR